MMITPYLYADSQSSLDTLEGFASGGLRADKSVIATEIHRRALDRKLTRRGYDLERAKLDNRYIAADAVASINRFMVDGRVDSEKFNACVIDFFPCVRQWPTGSCVWRDGCHPVGAGRSRLDDPA